MKLKFKISIDIHGVIDELPEFFSHMTQSLVEGGMEVHIVTGGSYNRAERELKKYKIRYTHLFSILDHHKLIGTTTYGNHPKYGFPMIDDDTWDKTKGEYCEANNIHLHLDDTITYGDSFTTPFAKVWTKNKGAKYNQVNTKL